MSTTETQIPKQITIDVAEGQEPITLDVENTPALKDLVQAARIAGGQTEKTKLYDTIESLKKTNKELTDEVVTLKAAPPVSTPPATPSPKGMNVTDAETTKRNQEIEARKKQNREESATLTQEDVNNLISKAFEDNLPQILQKAVNPLVEKTKAIEQATLNEYKAKRLSELGDQVIPELIKGNTKEEIEESIASAIEIRSRYAGTPAAPVTPGNQPPETPPVVPTPQAAPVVVPHIETPPQMELDVKNMTPEQYKEQREKVLKEVSALVPK